MELKDPLKNRIVTSIPPPLALSLKHEQLFDKNSVNYNLLRKFYKREGKLSKPLYMELIRKAKSLYCNTFFTQKKNQISSDWTIQSLLLVIFMGSTMI